MLCETASDCCLSEADGPHEPVLDLSVPPFEGLVNTTVGLRKFVLIAVFRESILKNHIWCSVGSELNSENCFCSQCNIVSTNKGKHCNNCRL